MGGGYLLRTMGETSDSVFDIHQADARNLKSELEKWFESTDGVVDAIITSPPYADMQDYGDQEGQIGEQLYEDFLEDLRTIFKQCYDVASAESTLWIVTDTFRRNNRIVRPPFDIADELENLEKRRLCPDEDCNGRLQRDRGTGILHCDICGEEVNPLDESWQLKDHLIWNKQRTRPWRKKGQLRNIYEHISMYAKTDDYKYNADSIRIQDTDEFGRWWVNYPERYHPKGKLPENIWEFPIPKQGEWGPKLNYHPSPFPEPLVERIIKLATDPGDVVLDPFAGVGSTLAVAKRLSRRPIGFELNEDFIEHYHKHVLPAIEEQETEQQTEQQTLFDEEGGHNLEYLIWTLRIHKYAFRLQRELVSNEEIDIQRKDLSSVLAVTDPETIGIDTKPQTQLCYLGSDKVRNLNDIFDQAAENLISANRGSGDYYEVDFELNAYPVEDWFEETASQVLDLSSINPLYAYPDGVHHWYQTELTFDQWRSMIENGEWKRYQSTHWVPLVSNLGIQVENPQQEVDEIDGKQTVLGNFDETN